MSSNPSLERPKTVFDSWRAMTASLYLAIVGYGVLVGIPVISTAWVNLLGFSEVQVGRLAGADLGGLSIGSVVTAMIISRFNRRILVFIALVTCIGANALCMLTSDYETVLVLRLIAGLGSGIYTSIAVASLGATAKPARALNLLLFLFAFSQAFELHVLPQLSMNGIYLVFVIANLIGIVLVPWLPPRAVAAPARSIEDSDQDQAQNSIETPGPRSAAWLVLAAIAFSYVNIGAYWTYIELASTASPFTDADWVGQVLVWASFLSIVGCLVATVISDRFGLARPLIVTLFVHAIIVGMLALGINNVNIVVSLFTFNFLWIFIDVYQMATIANIDRSGRFAALVPGAQGLGQIVGPNLAASIIALGYGYDTVFIFCAAASITAMFIYSYMYLRLRRAYPALADAS